mmetsp:Transcript_31723/g.57428  ORF Transcript_31723/g.57428 Transcript_31723/m.57428 type:complete len:134 (-) Transcript_31723:1177-1578(-)
MGTSESKTGPHFERHEEQHFIIKGRWQTTGKCTTRKRSVCQESKVIFKVNKQMMHVTMLRYNDPYGVVCHQLRAGQCMVKKPVVFYRLFCIAVLCSFTDLLLSLLHSLHELHPQTPLLALDSLFHQDLHQDWQ